MNRVLINTVLMLAILSPVRTIAQGQQTGEEPPPDWWVNTESSPLVFEIHGSRRILHLFNNGSKTIKSYRLGCVLEERGKLRVLHRMAVVKRDLAPNQGLLNSVYVYDEDRSRCDRKRAKLSVVEVVFSDGSRWKTK